MFSKQDFLLTALWWGLVAGLAEGIGAYYAQSYIWHDQMRAAVMIEPLLFVAVPLVIVGVRRTFVLRRGELMRVSLLFAGMALFAAVSRAIPWVNVLIRLLVAVAAASLIAFIIFLLGKRTVRWQRRTLPVLLAAAVWCGVVFPLKQARHEQHELARLHSAPAGAPNVLVIVVDTLRADHLSTYGYSRPTSPYLTQLSREGVLFENAIAPSSWTLPVHASLVTGLYPHAHHVDTSSSYFGWHYPTVGEEFMARGYRTAAFSANTLLFCRQRGFGRGFIHFEDDFQTPGSTFAQTFYGGLLEKLLYRLKLKRDLLGRLRAAQINRHALRWMDSDRRPFLVFLNYFDVHDPYLPPEPYLHRYTRMKHPGGRASNYWSWFSKLTPEELQGARDAYDGSINYVDDQIQELMGELKRRGLDRNTLVVITSDHGESFDEHGFMNHGNALYRELIHVPLIFWEPGRVPAGVRIATPVSLVSLPETLLVETGNPAAEHFPGGSLAQLWMGTTPAVERGHPVSELAQLLWDSKFPDYYGPIDSVTTSQWHYINSAKSGEELYRCCDDAPETTNLAHSAEGQKICAQLRHDLQVVKSTPAGEMQPSAARALETKARP